MARLEDQHSQVKAGSILLLACGNPLRGDDGVGWKIAEALEVEWAHDPLPRRVRIIVTQQLTPELAMPLSEVETAILVDCSIAIPPGNVSTIGIEAMPASDTGGLTHHVEFSSVLHLARELYRVAPRAYAVAVGGESLGLSESLSNAVKKCIPEAVAAIKQLVAQQHRDL